MEKVDLIADAINNRNPIHFDYTESDNTITHREWNPHVLYMYESVDKKVLTMKLWIFQTGWETESWLNKFKDFLSIENVNDIVVLKDQKFEKDTLFYNSDSPRYKNPYAKI